MVESLQSKHAEVIQRLAPKVLDSQTMSRLLDTDPKSRTHDEFEFVRALESEFNAPATRLFKVLGTDFTERKADEDVVAAQLFEIEKSAKSREPQVTEGMVTIKALAPKVLATTPLLDLVSRSSTTRSPNETKLLQAINVEYGLSPLGIAKAMRASDSERTQKQGEFVSMIMGLLAEVEESAGADSTEIPQFLKNGQTIREALLISNSNPMDLAKSTFDFLVVMADTLGTTLMSLEAALTKDLASCTKDQIELRAKSRDFEDKWEKILSDWKSGASAEAQDSVAPKPLTLTELQMSKLDVLYWKREALRLQYQRALETAKEVRSEVSCVEQDFEVLAASLSLDTTRHFSWDAQGAVTYQDAENKSPIRPKGR